MKFSSLPFLLTIALSLTSCSFRNAENGSDTGPTSRLEASQVSVVDVDNGTANSYGFPPERQFRLKTCLTDPLKWTPAGGEKVTIKKLKGVEKTESDAAGCVYWTETFHF